MLERALHVHARRVDSFGRTTQVLGTLCLLRAHTLQVSAYHVFLAALFYGSWNRDRSVSELVSSFSVY